MSKSFNYDRVSERNGVKAPKSGQSLRLWVFFRTAVRPLNFGHVAPIVERFPEFNANSVRTQLYLYRKFHA